MIIIRAGYKRLNVTILLQYHGVQNPLYHYRFQLRICLISRDLFKQLSNYFIGNTFCRLHFIDIGVYGAKTRSLFHELRKFFVL